MKDTGLGISNGNAGEYYVAAELERRGFSVAVPMSNVPTFDLLAIDRSNLNHQIAIQVKTRTKTKPEWVLNDKNEEILAKNFIYIFVHMPKDQAPSFHIVPSEEVSKYLKEWYADWIATPGKIKAKRKETTFRMFHDYHNYWLNRWDLLKK